MPKTRRPIGFTLQDRVMLRALQMRAAQVSGKRISEDEVIRTLVREAFTRLGITNLEARAAYASLQHIKAVAHVQPDH